MIRKMTRRGRKKIKKEKDTNNKKHGEEKNEMKEEKKANVKNRHGIKGSDDGGK